MMRCGEDARGNIDIKETQQPFISSINSGQNREIQQRNVDGIKQCIRAVWLQILL